MTSPAQFSFEQYRPDLALASDAVAHVNHLLHRIWIGRGRAGTLYRRHPPVVDLALGYLHGGELEHGWWERARRINQPRNDELSDETWLVRVVDAVPLRAGDVPLERWVPWIGRAVGRRSMRITLIGRAESFALRKRLEEETGYRTLSTPADCVDASRVYPRGSIAARFLVAAAEYCTEVSGA